MPASCKLPYQNLHKDYDTRSWTVNQNFSACSPPGDSPDIGWTARREVGSQVGTVGARLPNHSGEAFPACETRAEIARPDRQNALTKVNSWHYIHLGKSNCLVNNLSVHVESRNDSRFGKEIRI